MGRSFLLAVRYFTYGWPLLLTENWLAYFLLTVEIRFASAWSFIYGSFRLETWIWSFLLAVPPLQVKKTNRKQKELNCK